MLQFKISGYNKNLGEMTKMALNLYTEVEIGIVRKEKSQNQRRS